ncbi:MAG: PQQ-binding-like beta-propeller repeat protein [Planctomycetes bacterium]|nr:PQQ-binding-like beta-propeller repeat protein [Planctomycetota bacterium]
MMRMLVLMVVAALAAMFAVSESLGGESTPIHVDKSKRLLWKTDRVSAWGASQPLRAHGDALFDDDGDLVLKIDSQTGKEMGRFAAKAANAVFHKDLMMVTVEKENQVVNPKSLEVVRRIPKPEGYQHHDLCGDGQGRVYQGFRRATDGSTRFIAWDIHTGKTLWDLPIDKPGWTLAKGFHGGVFAWSNSGTTTFVDSSTGKTLWSIEEENRGQTGIEWGGPLVNIHLKGVFEANTGKRFGEADGKISPDLRGWHIRPESAGADVAFFFKDGAVRAMSFKPATQVWERKLDGLDKGSMGVRLLPKEGLLVFCGNAPVYCLDQKTGKERWKTEVGRTTTTHDALLAGDVIVLVADAWLQGLDLATGKILWSLTVPSEVPHSAYAVVGNVVFFRHREGSLIEKAKVVLRAVNTARRVQEDNAPVEAKPDSAPGAAAPPACDPLWTTATDEPIVRIEVAPKANHLLLQGRTSLTVVDRKSGKSLWKKPCEGFLSSEDGAVIYVMSKTRLEAVATATGKVTWAMDNAPGLKPPMWLDRNLLYLTAMNGDAKLVEAKMDFYRNRLWALNRSDGKRVWEWPAGRQDLCAVRHVWSLGNAVSVCDDMGSTDGRRIALLEPATGKAISAVPTGSATFLATCDTGVLLHGAHATLRDQHFLTFIDGKPPKEKWRTEFTGFPYDVRTSSPKGSILLWTQKKTIAVDKSDGNVRWELECPGFNWIEHQGFLAQVFFNSMVGTEYIRVDSTSGKIDKRVRYFEARDNREIAACQRVNASMVAQATDGVVFLIDADTGSIVFEYRMATATSRSRIASYEDLFYVSDGIKRVLAFSVPKLTELSKAGTKLFVEPGAK